jgi:hypothetical protein
MLFTISSSLKKQGKWVPNTRTMGLEGWGKKNLTSTGKAWKQRCTYCISKAWTGWLLSQAGAFSVSWHCGMTEQLPQLWVPRNGSFSMKGFTFSYRRLWDLGLIDNAWCLCCLTAAPFPESSTSSKLQCSATVKYVCNACVLLWPSSLFMN